MKHRQVGVGKVGVVNPDGHAIGLDIGATSVRASVLAPGMLDGRPSVTVHGLGRVELARGVVVNGVVADQAALIAALKHLWHTHKFECRNVIVGVANQQIVVRDMQVPNLPAEQLVKALPYQAKDIVALPISEVVLDFAPLADPDPQTNTVDGLLIATPRQPVLAAVHAVERAGLKVARVDLASFAALRSIADENLAVEAVIDVGAHMTTVVIHDQGIPRVVRTLPRGGEELTERIVADIGLAPDDAEAAKRSVGLGGGHAEISRVLAEGIRPLIAEMRSSIRYFNSVGPHARLERIALTGGGALLPGLAEAFTDQLDVPAIVVNPMQHIRNRLASKQAQSVESEGWASAVSVGLAMGAAA